MSQGLKRGLNSSKRLAQPKSKVKQRIPPKKRSIPEF